MIRHQFQHFLCRLPHKNVCLLLLAEDVIYEGENEYVELLILLDELQIHLFEKDEVVIVCEKLNHVAFVIFHGDVFAI